MRSRSLGFIATMVLVLGCYGCAGIQIAEDEDGDRLYYDPSTSFSVKSSSGRDHGERRFLEEVEKQKLRDKQPSR